MSRNETSYEQLQDSWVAPTVSPSEESVTDFSPAIDIVGQFNYVLTDPITVPSLTISELIYDIPQVPFNVGWVSGYSMALRELRTLKSGWNGYDAPAPSNRARDGAHKLLDALRTEDLRPSHMGPSVSGGVGFTFENDEWEFIIEYLNNGVVLTTIIDERDQDAELGVSVLESHRPEEEIIDTLRELKIV